MLSRDVVDSLTPDVAQPLRGVRLWHYRADALWGIAFDAIWSPTMRAECDGRLMHEAHEAPQANCRCGLHAFRGVERLMRSYDTLVPETAFGEVDLWGRVEVHDWGFRAEHARIVGLYDTDDRVRGYVSRRGLALLPTPPGLRAWLQDSTCGCHQCWGAAADVIRQRTGLRGPRQLRGWPGDEVRW